MDEAEINRLLQNALDEANARAEQKFEERFTALREEINQKHQEEMIELQPTGDKMRALFSHAPIKVLADHLDALVNNPQDFCKG